MNCFYPLRRYAYFISFIRRLIGGIATFSMTLSVHAGQLEQHQERVAKFIAEQHADPLAADCAAHASFVVSTSPLYDRIEFARHTLDDRHALIIPWHDSFNNRRQRVEVDTTVKIAGIGYRKSGARNKLTVHCGYWQNKMLAFTYHGPKQPIIAKKRLKTAKHAPVKPAGKKYRKGRRAPVKSIRSRRSAKAAHRAVAKRMYRKHRAKKRSPHNPPQARDKFRARGQQPQAAAR